MLGTALSTTGSKSAHSSEYAHLVRVRLVGLDGGDGSAIDDVFAAVNGGGAVGGEEGDEFRDFFRATGTADGNPSE